MPNIRKKPDVTRADWRTTRRQVCCHRILEENPDGTSERHEISFYIPLAATHHRRHLHGDDRQPSIWMDAVCRTYRRQVPLGASVDTGCLHDFCIARDVAGAGGRLSGRPIRPALGRGHRRGAVRYRGGDKLPRGLVCDAPFCPAARAGIGAGGVYGTCIGNAVKWFPGRRGLAAGLTAAGFGAGSALTVIPIAGMIKTAGYEQSFPSVWLAPGIVVVVLGFFLF